MKVFVFALFSLFSVFASAADSGLECTMEYSVSGLLETYSIEDTRWLAKGKEMEGSARVNDGDGFAGEAPANYIQVSQTQVSGQILWNVTVLNSEKSVVGSFSFPEDGGAKFSVPVNAIPPYEPEDPPQFDTLNVTCSFTYFVG